jgi:hypothetical protein
VTVDRGYAYHAPSGGGPVSALILRQVGFVVMWLASAA